MLDHGAKVDSSALYGVVQEVTPQVRLEVVIEQVAAVDERFCIVGGSRPPAAPQREAGFGGTRDVARCAGATSGVRWSHLARLRYAGSTLHLAT